MVMYDEFVQSITENVEETLDEAWFHNNIAPHREPNQPIPGPIVTEIPVTSTTVRKGFTYEVTLTSSDTLLETGGVSLGPTDTFWDLISEFGDSSIPNLGTTVGLFWSPILASPGAVRGLFIHDIGSNNKAYLYFPAFSPLQTINWGSRRLQAAHFSADGVTLCLFTSIFISGTDYTLEAWKYIWDSDDLEYKFENTANWTYSHRFALGCSARHPTENYIMVGGRRGTGDFCDMLEFEMRNPAQTANIRREIRQPLESNPIRDANWDALDYNHDGSLLAGLCEENNKVYVYPSSSSGTNPSSTIISLPNSSSAAKAVSFSKNGAWLAVPWTGRRDIRIYNTSGWTVAATISRTSGVIQSIDFSENNEFMALVALSGRVEIYQTSNWSLVYTRTTGSPQKLLFNQGLTNEADSTESRLVTGTSVDNARSFEIYDLKTETAPQIIYQNFPALDVSTGDVNVKGAAFFNPRRPG